MDWELICHQNQANIYKENTRKNSKILDRNYEVGDKVMLNNNTDLRYDTPYKGSFEITQFCTNVTVTLQYGAIKIRYNISFIKSYTYDTRVDDNIS